MARLESEKKGGFYPTPPEEMKLILDRLTCDVGDKLSLLDPCTGGGLALRQWQDDLLAKGSNPTSYGIELEKSRANEASHIVDHVLNCGYEESKMSHGAFSAMYLNPPFASSNKDRQEAIFLRDLTENYLQPGGILIFNLPQYVLKDCAKILASRFTDLHVYRFTDANYDTYKQVIVFGIRRAKGLRTWEEKKYQSYMEEQLCSYSEQGKYALPSLDEEVEFQYKIPPNLIEVAMFKSMKVEEEDILNSLQTCGFFKKIEGKVKDLNVLAGKQVIPAMPLKVTHLATAIASGALPEEMGDHLLVGVSKRVQTTTIRENAKSGKPEEVTEFKSKSLIRIFSEQGIINLK